MVDHTSIALFDQIPAEYLEAARQLHVLYNDRSVGENISSYLNCLAAPSYGQSPAFCRKSYSNRTVEPWEITLYSDIDLAPDDIKFPTGAMYDRSNWAYLSQSGEWSYIVSNFITSILPTYQDYNVVTFQFSYLNVMEDSSIDDPQIGFFADDGNYTNARDIYDLLRAEIEYPDITFVYWTTSLSRGIGTIDAANFNAMMRDFAVSNDKILFDVADIESLDLQGSMCYDNRDGVRWCAREGACEDYPDDGVQNAAICPDYTTELDGGHLGSISSGGIRLAKAYWVLMARIAGWNPYAP